LTAVHSHFRVPLLSAVSAITVGRAPAPVREGARQNPVHFVEHCFDSRGLEYLTESKHGANLIVQRVDTVWQGGGDATNGQPFNPRPGTVTTTLGSVRKQSSFAYTGGFDIFRQDHSDWFPVNGNLINLIRTEYTYFAGQAPSLITISKWNGSAYAMQSKTEIAYNQFLLTSTANVPGKTSSPSFRRNPTTIKRNTSSSAFVQDEFRYDDLGNVVSQKDPLGHETKISYADNFSGGNNNRNTFAFPTCIVRPVDTNANTCASPGTSLVSKTVYDYNAGLVTKSIDPRNLETTFQYDLFGRQTSVTRSNLQILETEYFENELRIQERASVSAGVKWTTDTYTDLFQRTRFVVERDPASGGDVHVETEYDGDGRVKKTSLPYRPGQTKAYVETAYDVLNRLLNRTVTITQPGSAAVSFSYTHFR
jgi:YD repeat-containing protein